METTLNIDLGMIVMALAPTIAIVVAAFMAKRDAAKGSEKLDGIHTLVNDAMTREKRARLDDLRAQKVVLEKILGSDMTEEHLSIILGMEEQIERLRKEVLERDRVASKVSGFPS